MEEPKNQTENQSEDVTSDYANNTLFDASIWDLKILFGEWSGRTKSVDWHTSITIPWAQAKLMAYYLAVNVDAHEQRMGKIPFPSAMVPPEPQPVKDLNDKSAIAFNEMVLRRRKDFIESL